MRRSEREVLLAFRLCGERSPSTVVSVKSNKMEVVFNSDMSYVDRGFSAEFQAYEPSDRKSEAPTRMFL